MRVQVEIGDKPRLTQALNGLWKTNGKGSILALGGREVRLHGNIHPNQDRLGQMLIADLEIVCFDGQNLADLTGKPITTIGSLLERFRGFWEVDEVDSDPSLPLRLPAGVANCAKPGAPAQLTALALCMASGCPTTLVMIDAENTLPNHGAVCAIVPFECDKLVLA